nr:MAG TPA: hypothetical protein [Bacteriophage sp.]
MAFPFPFLAHLVTILLKLIKQRRITSFCC